MRAIWKIISSTPAAEPVFAGGAHAGRLQVIRSPAARHMRLVVRPGDAAVRLTIPKRASLAEALRWAESKPGWIEA